MTAIFVNLTMWNWVNDMQVLYFGDKDCPPCVTMKPRVQEWAEKNGVDFFAFGIADVYGGNEMAKRCKVRCAPTAVLLDDDCQEVERIVGLQYPSVIGELFGRFTKPPDEKPKRTRKKESEVKQVE